VFWPFPFKYLLFAYLAVGSPPLRVAVPLWIVGCAAVHVFAVRRSLASIRKKLIVENPERCIRPTMIAFVPFTFFSIFMDIAMSVNSGGQAGLFILLSLILNTGILVYQSFATQRAFNSMPGATPAPAKQSSGFLVAIADFALVVIFLGGILAVMSGTF